MLRGHEYLSHPFAVTLYGGEVYWTDWRTNTLAKANKWTGHNVTVVQRTNTQPFDLQVYHPSRQPLGEAWGSRGSRMGWEEHGGDMVLALGVCSYPLRALHGNCSHHRGCPFSPLAEPEASAVALATQHRSVLG